MTEHSAHLVHEAVPPVIERDPAEVLDQLAPRIRLLQNEMAKVIIGQEEVIMAALYALFSRGHCLLVGVPGLAKTLLVQTLAHPVYSRPDAVGHHGNRDPGGRLGDRASPVRIWARACLYPDTAGGRNQPYAAEDPGSVARGDAGENGDS